MPLTSRKYTPKQTGNVPRYIDSITINASNSTTISGITVTRKSQSWSGHPKLVNINININGTEVLHKSFGEIAATKWASGGSYTFATPVTLPSPIVNLEVVIGIRSTSSDTPFIKIERSMPDFSFYQIESCPAAITSSGTLFLETGQQHTITADKNPTDANVLWKWNLNGVSISGTSSAQSGTLTLTADQAATWLALLPTSTSGTGTITATISYGGVQRAVLTNTFNVTVPASVAPTIAGGSVSESGADLSGTYVRGKSYATISGATIRAGAGSSITKVILTIGGQSNSAINTIPKVGILNTAGSMAVALSITDGRNRTVTKSYGTITVYDWAAPQPTMTGFRCSADGMPSDDDIYASITLSKLLNSKYPIGGKNKTTVDLRYKTSASSTWTNVTDLPTDSDVVTKIIEIGAENANTFELIVSDVYASVVRTLAIPAPFVIMDWKNEGQSIGIGMPARDDAKELNIGLPIITHDEFTVQQSGQLENNPGLYNEAMVRVTNDTRIGRLLASAGSRFGLYDDNKGHWLIYSENDSEGSAHIPNFMPDVANVTIPATTSVRESTLILYKMGHMVWGKIRCATQTSGSIAAWATYQLGAGIIPTAFRPNEAVTSYIPAQNVGGARMIINPQGTIAVTPWGALGGSLAFGGDFIYYV